MCRIRPLLQFIMLSLLMLLGTPVFPQDAPTAENTAAAEPESVEQMAPSLEPAADDLRIEEFIQERLNLIDSLKAVRVNSAGGVVQLSGEVVKSSQREIAEKLAQGAPGVVAVENDIEVTQDVRERTLPALEQASEKFQRMLRALPLFFIGLAVFLLFFFTARWLSNLKLLDRLVPRHRFMNNLLRQGIYYAGILAGSIVVLDLLDAAAWVGALLGTAGIVGLAVGFGVKDLVENQFASILLSLRQPFAPNDHVVIDGQYEGKVISLNSRATILMTLEGNHLRLPNAQVFKSVILNYTRNPNRRFDFTVGVGVNEDLTQAQRLGTAVLMEMEGVLRDPAPMGLIISLGDSSVAIQFLAWVNQTDSHLGKVKSEAIRLVKAALESADIDLPEPIYRVNLIGNMPPSIDSEEAPTVAEPVPKKFPSRAEPQADVSADHYVDELVFQERAVADSENLLDRNMPRE